MATSKELRRPRSFAWQAMLRRLRHEFPDDHTRLYMRHRGGLNATQTASAELRRMHPERAAEIYREEVLARGLPAPVKTGRWAAAPGGEPS